MKQKYDKIGMGYNLTRKADTYLTEQLLRHLKPTQSGNYLDIGCGTGNYTNEFQKRGYQFIGIDPSKQMLEIAKLRNNKIDWKLGSVENIELPSNSVDGIIGSLTIHHWTNLNLGFSELHKVSKPNGRIVLFTATPQQMKGYWLNHYFPKMLSDSIKKMPSFERIKEACFTNGIELLESFNYSIKPDLQDLFLYSGKHNPELYFDDKIRQGISSFSLLANSKEIDDSMAKLRIDIDSGHIQNIIKSYENDLGDYVFIIGKKLSNTSIT